MPLTEAKNQEIFTQAIRALNNENIDAFEAAINTADFDMYGTDNEGATLLKSAEMKFVFGNNRFLASLIKKNFDLNRYSVPNACPFLSYVIFNPGMYMADGRFDTAKHLEQIKMLLDGGANPNLQDNRGNTALHYAPNEQVIELLFKNKIIDINPKIKNSRGQTAAEYFRLIRKEGLASKTENMVEGQRVEQTARAFASAHIIERLGRDSPARILPEKLNKELSKFLAAPLVGPSQHHNQGN